MPAEASAGVPASERGSAGAAAERNTFDMEEASGEREGPNRKALSLDPTGSNPSRPSSPFRPSAPKVGSSSKEKAQHSGRAYPRIVGKNTGGRGYTALFLLLGGNGSRLRLVRRDLPFAVGEESGKLLGRLGGCVPHVRAVGEPQRIGQPARAV